MNPPRVSADVCVRLDLDLSQLSRLNPGQRAALLDGLRGLSREAVNAAFLEGLEQAAGETVADGSGI